MLTVFTDRWALKVHARERNRVLAEIDEDTLRPLSPADMDRRRAITRRMARKGILLAAFAELRASLREIAIACACAAPVSVAYVAWLALA